MVHDVRRHLDVSTLPIVPPSPTAEGLEAMKLLDGILSVHASRVALPADGELEARFCRDLVRQ